MGEIGIDRREYLYELKYWEILLISRGYQKRQHPAWEQARLMAYCAAHAMGSKEPPPPPKDWIRFPWESETRAISEEEEAELMAEMDAIKRMQEEKNRAGD